MMDLRWLAIAVLLTFASGCSNYQYKTYMGNVDDPTIKILDLSGGSADAPVIHFDTMQYRDLGVPFHRLLLAVQVDGKRLPHAGRHSLLNFSGYQAVRLAPGKHTIEWCWISMNKLGTGGGMCGLGATGIELEAGKRYLATWSAATSIKGPPQREQMEIKVSSFVLDRDSGLQIYP